MEIFETPLTTNFMVHQIYTPAILKKTDMHCIKCGWEGHGKDSVQEYLFLTDATELYCPACSNYLGFISENEEE